MSNVEDRIVSLTFDNQNFERRIASTLDSLDKLTQGLKLKDAADGFTAVTQAADSVNLSGISDGIDNINSKFSAMGAVAFSVIQNVSTQFLQMAQTIPTNLLDQVIGGGKTRALNLEQARFLFEGIGADVEKSMDNARTAVLGTAFGLDEAAKAAAQLEASGTEAGDSLTGQLRGIAGVAAMTNSSFSEISDVFTQAAGQGKVSGYTLERISQRGLNVASVMAKQLGKTEAEIRQMASDGTIDFKTFAEAMDKAFGAHATEANKTYTGALANLHAAMSRLGAEIETPKLRQERDLFNALTPAVDNVHAALKPLLNTFTDLTQIGISGLIGKVNNLNLDNLKTAAPFLSVGLQNLVEGFHQITTAAHDAFRDIFPKSTESLILKFTAAFVKLSEKIKMGGETVEKIKFVFDAVFSVLNVGWVIIRNLARVFGILVGAILPLTGGLGDHIVHIARLVQWYTTLFVLSGKIDDFFNHFLAGIAKTVNFLHHVGDELDKFKEKISGLFGDKGGAGGIAGSEASIETPLTRFQQRLEQLLDLPGRISDAWGRLHDRFQGFFEVLGKVGDFFGTFVSDLGHSIAAAFGPGSFDQAVDAVSVGLLGGIFIIVKKFLKGGGLGDALSGGLERRIKGVFGQLNRTFMQIQSDLKADVLEKLAIAIGVMTAALLVLSLIDSAALTKALVAVAVGFGELVGTLTLMDKIDSNKSGLKLSGMAGSMILMATAIDVLAIAISVLGKMDPHDLAKGLIGVGVAMAMMAGISQAFAESGPSMIAAGIAMNLFAVGLGVLAGVIRLFALIKAGDMAKGLLGIALTLGILAGAMNAMPPASAISGIGLIEMAVGLTILAGAVKLFSLLGWAELAKGLVGITGLLLILDAAMSSMPLTTPIIAAGVVILGIALTILAGAVALMGNMDLGTLAKGIGSILALLLILDAAMQSMEGALPGAAALVVVAGALVILTNVIKDLGAMDTGDLIKGVLAIAATLAIIGLSAAVLQPVIPAIQLLGVALAIVGAAFLIFGAGAYLIAAALEKLAQSGVAGVKAIIESFKEIGKAMPMFVNFVGQMLLNFIEDTLNSLPLLLKLITGVLDALLDSLIKLLPKVIVVVGLLIGGILTLIIDHAPDYVKAGFVILMSLLKGISDNIEEIAKTAGGIVAKFLAGLLQGLTDNVDTLVDSLYKFLLKAAEALAFKAGQLQTAFIPIGKAFFDGLLQGLEDNVGGIFQWFLGFPAKILDIIKSAFGIDSPSTVFADMGGDLLLGLLNGLIEIVPQVLGWFMGLPGQIFGFFFGVDTWLLQTGKDLIGGFVTGLGDLLSTGTSILGDILKGIENAITDVPGTIVKVIEAIIGAISDPNNALRILRSGIDLFMGFFKSIGKVINDAGGELVSALGDLASAFVSGIGDALKSAIKTIANKLFPGLGTVVTGVLHFFGISSPSKKFYWIGKMLMQGFSDGIFENLNMPADSLSRGSDVMVGKMTETIQRIHDAIPDNMDITPTITPVLDLTKVQKDAGNIAKFMKAVNLTTDVSVGQANVISVADTARRSAASSQDEQQAGNDINFTQNNYSPEALSEKEIYHQTKSLLARKKEELGIS